MISGEQRLAEYAETGSEAAFREVVERYVDLVYSAAIRLVNGDAHLAEDVTQGVFADLARMARKVSPNTMLGGWLHRHACFVARNAMRGERRRQRRERSAVEMNSIEDHSEANLALIAPVLDEAINELPAEDRAAVVLRFFEQKDFRSVGDELGSNEEAARKRVHRALDKLRALLSRRGVALSATALTATLATGAVTAAPAGMAASISTAALASAAAGGGMALTLLQIMSMSKLKIGIAAVVIAAVAAPLGMQYRSNEKLRDENTALREQLAQMEALSAENARLSKLLAQGSSAPPPVSSNDPSREVLKLRGEVGRLRTAANEPRPSPLSGVIADPKIRQLIRDQQKAGMGMLYKEFATRLKLAPEMSQKFVDLLAEDIMEGVDHVGVALRDGKSREEIDRIFTEQELALQEKVKTLLGAEGYAEYQEYTQNLASLLTAEQFKGQLTGDKAAKEEKAKQLYDVMQQETQAALGAAGLPGDFQTLPMLNFRNIASEQEAEKNLGLMQNVYDRAIGRAGSFLTPEELRLLQDYRDKALENSRAALAMNRRMMAPGAK